MFYRTAAVTTFVTLLAISGATAQEAGAVNSEYTDISNYLVSPADTATETSSSRHAGGSGYNSASVNQVGLNNSTSVIQLGYANTTTQTQVGLNNVSALTLTGSGNTISTLQVGNSNTSSLNIAGSNNTISQTQIGTNLSYGLETTKSGQSFSVQQIGRK